MAMKGEPQGRPGAGAPGPEASETMKGEPQGRPGASAPRPEASETIDPGCPRRAAEVIAPVRGMHCAACVDKVERALKGVAGVDRASVNLATEQATVSFDPERTSVDALQAAVTAAG